jgi:hypothetical protein
MNGSREIRRLREKLNEDYYDWQSEKLSERWDDADVPSLLTQYFSNNDGLEGEELELAVADEIDSPGRIYDEVQEEYWDDLRDIYSEEKWFKGNGIRYMSDIDSEYDFITWPHWTTGSSGGGDVSAEDAAKSFEQTVGRKVVVSTGYHDYNVKRQRPGDEFYIAEPDASIEGDDGDGGLEFVSPPLSIPEMIKDLNKVINWCKAGHAYTNDSTGLHMNISVPNYNFDNLDFIKLALLMGDDHVSESFGRLGTYYAKSALGIIKRNIQNKPESAKQLLDQMKTHLNAAASKAVHSGTTDKFTSINVKDGRVEFRSPGGDWVSNFDNDEVENTLLRFVVALDAACDPSKYKEEYAKKLYKLLAPAGSSDDTIKYFAQYAAKMMPQAALKSFVRQAQMKRGINKDVAAGTGGKYWWKVATPNDISSIEVVASSEQEAKQEAYREWSVSLGSASAANWTVTPLRPYVEEPGSQTTSTAAQAGGSQDHGVKRYEIYNVNTGEVGPSFVARSEDEALSRLDIYLHDNNLGNTSYNVRLQAASNVPQPRAAELPPQTTRQFWRVLGANGQYVSVDAPNEMAAAAEAYRRYGAGLGPSTEYTVTRIETQ